MPKLMVKMDATGLGFLSIDGHDISDVVEGIAISTCAGLPNDIVIRLKPIAIALEGDFEGIEIDYPKTKGDITPQ